MANDVVQADYEKLEQIAGRFRDVARLSAQLESTVRQRAEPLRTGWIGKGSDAFMHEMDTQVFPSVHRLIVALDQASDVTQRIAEVVKTAEHEAAKLFAYNEDAASDDTVRSVQPLSEDYRINGTAIRDTKVLFARGLFDSRAIHPNDLVQGSLGDCFLISAMASVADRKPELIRDAVRRNEDGTYTVSLYQKRSGAYEKVDVIVKPEFPKGQGFVKEIGKWIPAVVDVGRGDREMWPRLIEKAYGQLTSASGEVGKVYSKLDEGGHARDALAALSGVDSQTNPPGHYPIEKLAELHDKKHALTLSSLHKDSPSDSDYYSIKHGKKKINLVHGHEYWIESVDKKRNVVIVRNPWGYGHSKIEIPFSKLGAAFSNITVNSLDKK